MKRKRFFKPDILLFPSSFELINEFEDNSIQIWESRDSKKKKEKSIHELQSTLQKEVGEQIQIELDLLWDKDEVFYGSRIERFTEYYHQLSVSFGQSYPDGNERDFFKTFLEDFFGAIPFGLHLNNYNYRFDVSEEYQKRLEIAFNRVLDFLTEKSNYLNLELALYTESEEPYINTYSSYEPFLEQEVPFTFELKEVAQDDYSKVEFKLPEEPLRLEWNGDYLELCELVKALVESRRIQGTQTEIFETFHKLFQFTDKTEKPTLQTIKKRTTDKTPFLYFLENALTRWINK